MPGLLSLLQHKSPQNLSYLCSVNFLDLTDPISVTYHRHTKGSYLIEHVNHSIDLTDPDYFGLKYLDDDKLECWLDPTKSIYSQLRGVSNPVFHFRVRFYPSDPDIIHDDVTRYQLYLQVQKDFEEGRLICPLKEALVLSAYVVQGVLGDYDNVHATTPPNSATTPILGSISLAAPPNMSTSTPKPSRSQPVDYITEARLPESLRPFKGDIMLLHRKIKGMDQNTSELNFLKEASCLNSYGMHPYIVADINGNNLYLTLTPKGVVIFEDNIATNFIEWNNVKKTTFDGKLFYVKSYIKSTSPTLKPERETKMVVYRCATSKACKHLWKNSVAHKFFFTLNSSEEAPKVLHSGGLLSRGGRFRYSGRCLNEMYKSSISAKDDSKSISTDSAKKISSDILKYSTLPRGRNSSHVEETFDASEDEKSLLNKTATSIVLNYLSNNNEEGIYTNQGVKRSLTINNPIPSNLSKQHITNENIIAEDTNTNNKFNDTEVANEETDSKAHSTLPSGKTTTKHHKFLSDNFNNTTKAFSAATFRLKQFFNNKKHDAKHEVKVEARIENNNIEELKVEKDIPKKSSIFKNADLSHGDVALIPSSDHSVSLSSEASTQPAITSINAFFNTNTQAFSNPLKPNDKNSPTTLHTSTIVTTIRTTHSSTHIQPFDLSKSNPINDDDENKDNYFNKNFNYVDETIRRTEEIIEKIENNGNLSKDSNRKVVFDGNDTGYLSGSDALNFSFEGRKSTNVKDLSKKGNDFEVKNQTAKINQNDNEKSQKDATKSSKEKLLNLLTYETSITDERTNNEQASNDEQNIEKSTNFISSNAQIASKKTKTHLSNKGISLNLLSPHQIPDLSPSTPSSSASKGSTVLTPDAYECENLQDLEIPSNTTISSVIDQASTNVNTLGVLSEDNFEKIKEIRKLLQENKDKIQEIRENIDVEIRNSLNSNVVKKEFPPDYQFCYSEGLQDEAGEDIEKEDETPSDDEEFKTANDVETGKPFQEFNEDDDEGEETIFLDRSYTKNTKREASDNENNDEQVPFPKRFPKPKHIAFSTKHYEWYSENGMGSGGGGVIYTFCGGPIGFGEVKCPSDCGLVKNSPLQEDIKVTDDLSKLDIQLGRKASIGRSISSIEGFYKADNVHHYNPNFDEEVEVVNQTFCDINDHKPFEISIPKREDGFGAEERVVIGGADNRSPCENISKDEFISSKISDLTKPILNSSDKRNLSKNKVTFSDDSLNSKDNADQLSTLQKDVLTFDDLLQESKNFDKPFCKILSENPEARKIKSDFDQMNSKNIFSTYSAKNFSYDLNELNKSPVEEDLIVPKVASILYDDSVDVENIKLEKVTDLQSKLPKNQCLHVTNKKDTITKDAKENLESLEATKNGVDKVEVKPKSHKRSCLKAMLTSSIFAVAFFSVAMVILFETNKDKEYFSQFGPLSSFRSSVYDPYKDYLVCSIKKHFPSDLFGID